MAYKYENYVDDSRWQRTKNGFWYEGIIAVAILAVFLILNDVLQIDIPLLDLVGLVILIALPFRILIARRYRKRALKEEAEHHAAIRE